MGLNMSRSTTSRLKTDGEICVFPKPKLLTPLIHSFKVHGASVIPPRRRNTGQLDPLLTHADPNTHDMMTILDEEELVASAVVFPGSTQEVQQVVRWANKHLIPIFPISMGRNRITPSQTPPSTPLYQPQLTHPPQSATAARPPASAAP